MKTFEITVKQEDDVFDDYHFAKERSNESLKDVRKALRKAQESLNTSQTVCNVNQQELLTAVLNTLSMIHEYNRLQEARYKTS